MQQEKINYTRDELKEMIVDLILNEELGWAFDQEVRDGEFSYFNMMDDANKVAEKILELLYV